MVLMGRVNAEPRALFGHLGEQVGMGQDKHRRYFGILAKFHGTVMWSLDGITSDRSWMLRAV